MGIKSTVISMLIENSVIEVWKSFLNRGLKFGQVLTLRSQQDCTAPTVLEERDVLQGDLRSSNDMCEEQRRSLDDTFKVFLVIIGMQHDAVRLQMFG